MTPTTGLGMLDPNMYAPGVLNQSQMNPALQSGENMARDRALNAGLMSAGAGLLAAPSLSEGLAAGLQGFNKAYDTSLVANRPKVTPLADGAFSQISFPDGTVQIVQNKDVEKFIMDKEKMKAEAALNRIVVGAQASAQGKAEGLGNTATLAAVPEIIQATQSANTLNDIANTLEKSSNLSGPFISMLPESVRSRVAPDSVKIQQDVERIVQNSLRATLGAQFTEKEGMAFLKRAYNPALKEADNATRLRNIASELQTLADNKQAAIEYLKKNKTLEGFKPSVTTNAPSGTGGTTSKIDKYIQDTD